MKNGIALRDINSLELFREWSEKRPCNDFALVRINCKVLGQTGSFTEFSHGILKEIERKFKNQKNYDLIVYNITLEKNY